jgi:hypothetical protein
MVRIIFPISPNSLARTPFAAFSRGSVLVECFIRRMLLGDQIHNCRGIGGI